MKGIRVGYVRVSSDDQNPDRQLEGIQVDRKFIDKASGKSVNRPQFAEMMRFLRDGDTLVCASMDRLARNLDDLRKIVHTLTKKGVCVEFVKENLTFKGDDSPIAILTLSIMGAFAEFERSIIRERQREGIELAKRRGVYKGRKPILNPDLINQINHRVKLGFSIAKVARDFNVSRAIVYKSLKSEFVESTSSV